MNISEDVGLIIGMQEELDQAQNNVENVHVILDQLHVPRDFSPRNRKLTPYGRLALLQVHMPKLWEHIQIELDKWVAENK